MGNLAFVVSLRPLRRTEGAISDFACQGSFDQEAVTGLVRLPVDHLVSIEGSLESVGEGVLVSATIHAELEAQCSRCLLGFAYPASVEIKELFVYPEHQEQYEETDIGLIKDEAIDLADTARDAIILDQPLIPLCRDDCRGLCPDCGADLNNEPNHQHAGPTDARWRRLGEWGTMP